MWTKIASGSHFTSSDLPEKRNVLSEALHTKSRPALGHILGLITVTRAMRHYALSKSLDGKVGFKNVAIGNPLRTLWTGRRASQQQKWAVAGTEDLGKDSGAKIYSSTVPPSNSFLPLLHAFILLSNYPHLGMLSSFFPFLWSFSKLFWSTIISFLGIPIIFVVNITYLVFSFSLIVSCMFSFPYRVSS